MPCAMNTQARFVLNVLLVARGRLPHT